MDSDQALAAEDEERYRRQTLLPEIGTKGQRRLAAAHVLVVGAGGLGSPVLLYLAAAGVGRLTVIDGDQVELSNLQRQILFTTEDVGRFKAERAAEKLRSLNPTLKIEAINERLTAANVLAFFDTVDCVVDGTDNFAAKFLINDAAVKTGKPLVYGSILRFEGQVSVFNLAGGPCYRCLYPERPKGAVQNCAEAGVIGAVAGIIGSMQALETIKILVGSDARDILAGALLTVDGLALSSRRFRIPKRDACPTCSKPAAEIQLTDLVEACGSVPEISQAAALEAYGGSTRFIDVREPNETAAGSIQGAELWPLSRMQKGELPEIRSRTILYCQGGVRSQRAGELLADKQNILSLSGGFAKWRGLRD